MSATVVILGLPQAIAKLVALPVVVQAAAEVGRAHGAARVAGRAIETAPTLTGAMAGSIAVLDEGAAVGVGERYAPFVEFGTANMEAQPFLLPAVETEESAVVSDVGDAVRVALFAL